MICILAYYANCPHGGGVFHKMDNDENLLLL